MLSLHPDVNPEDVENATIATKELISAYKVLKDAKSRRTYDQFGDLEGDSAAAASVDILNQIHRVLNPDLDLVQRQLLGTLGKATPIMKEFIRRAISLPNESSPADVVSIFNGIVEDLYQANPNTAPEEAAKLVMELRRLNYDTMSVDALFSKHATSETGSQHYILQTLLPVKDPGSVAFLVGKRMKRGIWLTDPWVAREFTLRIISRLPDPDKSSVERFIPQQVRELDVFKSQSPPSSILGPIDPEILNCVLRESSSK